MSPEETKQLNDYLQSKINPKLVAKTRGKTTDSLEVYLEEEFIALIYKDQDEGEVSYQFQMSILKEDLEDM